MQEHTSEIREIPSFSYEEIEEKLKALQVKKHEVLCNESEESKAYEKEQKLIDDFIQELLREKEKFFHVFKTEKGSFYFVLKSGHSLRIKARDDKMRLSRIQPICEKIFFIELSEKERLMEQRRRIYWLIGENIRTAPYGVGVVPVEYGIAYMPLKMTYREEEGNIVLEGGKFDENEKPQISSGIHFGHSITEVIK